MHTTLFHLPYYLDKDYWFPHFSDKNYSYQNINSFSVFFTVDFNINTVLEENSLLHNLVNVGSKPV